MITEEDFEVWKANPVTEAMSRMLRAKKDDAERYWSGALKDLTIDAARLALLKVELSAKLEFIEDIIGLSEEDLRDYEQDGIEEGGKKGRTR